MVLSCVQAELRRAAESAPGSCPRRGSGLFEAGRRLTGRGPVLEIGSYCGKSTIYWPRRPGGRPAVVTVDHHAARRSTAQLGVPRSRSGRPRTGRWTRCRRCGPRWPAGLEDHGGGRGGPFGPMCRLCARRWAGVHRRRAHRAGGDDGLQGWARWVPPGRAGDHDVFPTRPTAAGAVPDLPAASPPARSPRSAHRLAPPAPANRRPSADRPPRGP